MGFVAKHTPPETILEIRRAYLAADPSAEIDPVRAVAFDLDVSDAVVEKYTCDLPQRDPKREKRRLAILECLVAGLDVRATATTAECPIGVVVRVIEAQRAGAWTPPTPEQIDAKRSKARARASAFVAKVPGSAIHSRRSWS